MRWGRTIITLLCAEGNRLPTPGSPCLDSSGSFATVVLDELPNSYVPSRGVGPVSVVSSNARAQAPQGACSSRRRPRRSRSLGESSAPAASRRRPARRRPRPLVRAPRHRPRRRPGRAAARAAGRTRGRALAAEHRRSAARLSRRVTRRRLAIRPATAPATRRRPDIRRRLSPYPIPIRTPTRIPIRQPAVSVGLSAAGRRRRRVAPTAEIHDGGYIRLQLGISWTRAHRPAGTGHQVTYNGAGGCALGRVRLLVHAAPGPLRRVLHRRRPPVPTVKMDGTSVQHRHTPTSATDVSGVGLGAAYYFGPNIFAAATVLDASIDITDPEQQHPAPVARAASAWSCSSARSGGHPTTGGSASAGNCSSLR